MSNVTGSYPRIGTPSGAAFDDIGLLVNGEIPALAQGELTLGADPWYGGREFIFARSASAIVRTGSVVALVPVFDTELGQWSWEATLCPTTANLGRVIAVSVRPVADNAFGQFCVSGLVPVWCAATLAAGAAIGISGTVPGQAAANSAGHQILGALVAAPAATAIVRSGNTRAGSTTITLNSTDGLFIDMSVTGTGIPAGSVITGLDSNGRFLEIDNAATASGQVSLSFAMAATGLIHNLVMINRPNTQGAIT